MRRIHTTYDLLDAHLITAMLREHDIDALLFDTDFVRQNWLESIAYGGYRIMVSDASVESAARVLREYKNGSLALPDEHRLVCPRCGEQQGVENPWPRRHIFLVILILPWIVAIAFAVWKPTTTQMVYTSMFYVGLSLLLPWLAIRYFKWPLHCDACGYRWREPRLYRHAELAKMAESHVVLD